MLRQWPGLLLVLGFTAYLEYLAIRDLFVEVSYAKKNRVVRGYLVGILGVIAFYFAMQIVFLTSFLGSRSNVWEGPLVVITITGTVAGFFQGGKDWAGLVSDGVRDDCRPDCW